MTSEGFEGIDVIPGGQWCHGLESVGVADHLVQGADDLAEFRPVVAVFLPAVQHQLMQSTGTVHGGRQPVVLLYGIYDLQEKLMLGLRTALLRQKLLK